MNESKLIFETNLFQSNKLLISLKKNQQKTAKQFSLSNNVIKLLSSGTDLPSRLASDTFLSFSLEQVDLFFSRKIFLERTVESMHKSTLSFVDCTYWTNLKNLASIDVAVAVVGFGLPKNLVEWTLSASWMDLFWIAIGTTDRLSLRYGNSILEEILVNNTLNETLLCKKTILTVQSCNGDDQSAFSI